MSNIIIITGQTATGKTKKALQIASEVNGELINCDSRQIYKKLDIITGKDIGDSNYIFNRKVNGFDVGYYTINVKGQMSQLRLKASMGEANVKTKSKKSKIPTTNNQSPIAPSIQLRVNNRKSFSIPLWLYDVVDPKQYFSSYDYKILALDVISDILKRGKTPIIVGGAGYYLYHLLYDIPTSGIPQDWELRNNLSNKKTEELQKEYKLLDPLSYQKLNNSERNNTQRLIRKIEISLYKKKDNQIILSNELTSSLFQQFNISEKELEIHTVIENSKEKLKQNIDRRVNKRLENGALEEVRQLVAKGYNKNDPGLRTIGYQQLVTYLEGLVTLEQAKKDWITKEVQYAKRQATFIKKYIISAFLQHRRDF